MGQNFTLSSCQDFVQSGCQNRDASSVTLNMTSSGGPPLYECQGPSSLAVIGSTINAGYEIVNINLPTNGGSVPYSYGILGGLPLPIGGADYFNVLCAGINLWVQGQSTQLYGTISTHSIVSNSGGTIILSAPITSVLINGSPGQMYGVPGGAVGSGIATVIVFWVGLIPAAIPSGAINVSNGSLGSVLYVQQL